MSDKRADYSGAIGDSLDDALRIVDDRLSGGSHGYTISTLMSSYGAVVAAVFLELRQEQRALDAE
jgi:hypothetical protein